MLSEIGRVRLFLLMTISVAGCNGNPTEVGRVTAVVTLEALELEPTQPGDFGGSLEVTVANEGADTLWWAVGGAPRLQRLFADGTWRTVWSASTILVYNDIELPPGDSATRTFRVSSYGGGSAEPWTEPLGGDYRVVVSVSPPREDGRFRLFESDPVHIDFP